jgi:hypothetical protein
MTDTDTPRTTAPASSLEGDALTAEQIAAMRAKAVRVYDLPRSSDEPFYVCRDAVRLADECAALRDRLARAEERERELIAVLRKNEWVQHWRHKDGVTWWQCPECVNVREHGHKPYCSLGAALATPTDGAK